MGEGGLERKDFPFREREVKEWKGTGRRERKEGEGEEKVEK